MPSFSTHVILHSSGNLKDVTIGLFVKRLPTIGKPGFNLWVGKIPWRRKWKPTPVFLPGKFNGWRSLLGYNPWGCKELDTTERLHFTTFSNKNYVNVVSLSLSQNILLYRFNVFSAFTNHICTVAELSQLEGVAAKRGQNSFSFTISLIEDSFLP